jgi:hypothetical protein
MPRTGFPFSNIIKALCLRTMNVHSQSVLFSMISIAAIACVSSAPLDLDK